MMTAPCRFALGACIAGVLIATPTFAGMRITGPAPPSAPWFGLEFGPRISASVPTGAAGNAFDHGINAGVSITSKQSPVFGGGVDVDFSRWESPATGVALDALFSGFGISSVTGTKASLTLWQAGGHFRLSPLPGRGVQPWAQLGMGVSRADRLIEWPVVQLHAAGWQVTQAISNDVSYQPFYQTSAGFDVKTVDGVKLGLDASYEWVMFANERDPFTVYTIGGHLLFGTR